MLNCRGKRAQIKSLHMRVLPKLVTLVPYECGLISPHTVAGIRVLSLEWLNLARNTSLLTTRQQTQTATFLEILGVFYSFFHAKRINRSDLTERQQGIEIRPGMRATAELQTGSKTVLKYLLKPLYKSQEAFREP